MFHIYYNTIKILPETFYKKNSDFCTKNRCQLKKTKTIKPNRIFKAFFVFLGGFFIANPAINTTALKNEHKGHDRLAQHIPQEGGLQWKSRFR
jgi:hypothetical protein